MLLGNGPRSLAKPSRTPKNIWITYTGANRRNHRFACCFPYTPTIRKLPIVSKPKKSTMVSGLESLCKVHKHFCGRFVARIERFTLSSSYNYPPTAIVSNPSTLPSLGAAINRKRLRGRRPHYYSTRGLCGVAISAAPKRKLLKRRRSSNVCDGLFECPERQLLSRCRPIYSDNGLVER